MHPDLTEIIATLRVDEMHAAAAAARLARQAQAGRVAASLPRSAAAAGGRSARRRRLLGCPVPGRAQSA